MTISKIRAIMWEGIKNDHGSQYCEKAEFRTPKWFESLVLLPASISAIVYF